MGDTHSQREHRERSERAGAHQNRVKFHWNVWNALIISLLSQYGRPSLCARSLSLIIIPSALDADDGGLFYARRCKGPDTI